jgi:preprotein translocase subunit SecF
VELFHDPKIDWLGKKWYFLGFSLIFSVSGLLSIFFWHGLPLDVDFRGGTVVRVKFAQAPNADHIRAAIDKAGLKDARIQQPYGPAANNEVLVTLSRSATSEAAIDQGRAAIMSTLSQNYSVADAQNQGKLDLDNTSGSALTTWLEQKDPEHLGNTTDAEIRYQSQANAAVHFRDADHSGIIDSIDSLRGVVDPAVLTAFEQDAWLSGFSVRSVEIVGAQVGKVLQHQAELATLYSLAGMLVYLWFRFELIYGVAAVVACFHDTIITVGAFSLFDPRNLAHRHRRHSDPDRLLDERHHRRLRPHPREPAPQPPRAPGRSGQSQHQPDPEPDRADLRPHLSHRSVPLPLWR